MWIFLTVLVILSFLYQIFEKKSESDFMFFLSQSKVLSKEELKQIKKQEKEIKINYLFQSNLISQTQKKQLLALANHSQNKSKSVNWLLKLILLGLGCILLGSIAIIAHNWYFIPNNIKLLTYFGIFACSSVLFIHYALSHKKQKADLLGFFNIGWIFAGIALTGQIFHLTGSFESALLLGSALAVPFVLASHLKYLKTVWMFFFCLGAVLGGGQTFAPIIIFLALPIALYYKSIYSFSVIWIISLIYSLVQNDWFNQFISWYQLFFMPTAGAWIALAIGFSVCVGLQALCGKTAFVQTLKFLLFVLSGIALFNIDYTYSSETVLLTSSRYIQSVWGLFVCAWIPFASIGLGLKKNKNILFVLWGISLLTAFLYSFITYPLAGFILTLLCFSILAVLCIQSNNSKGFNFCLLAMIARIIAQYLDYVVLLAVTGIGFIGIGLAIILLAVIIKHVFNRKKGN